MTIPEFIKKYSFYRTFFISELGDLQLEELKSCEEFRNVQKFNVVNPHNTFFVNNAIDFNISLLKTSTKFNNKINIYSINIIGPLAIHDIYDLPEGYSQIKYVDEKTFKTMGTIVYKFDYDDYKESFLTEKETKQQLINNFTEFINNNLGKDTYHYFIGIRCHKDSVEELEFGKPITIPLEIIPDSLKLFKE